MFLDIGLTILSLVPGIGDGAIFAEAIVRVVKAVGRVPIFSAVCQCDSQAANRRDAIKVGRITQGVAASTKLSRALEVGVVTEEQAIHVGRSIDALLDAKTLETRGKLAKPMEKNNDVMRRTCTHDSSCPTLVLTGPFRVPFGGVRHPHGRQ